MESSRASVILTTVLGITYILYLDNLIGTNIGVMIRVVIDTICL